jgi:hypothetical protein
VPFAPVPPPSPAQVLQDDYGGFLDRERFVPDFTYYAAVAFEAFGGRVKNWITFNEPASPGLTGAWSSLLGTGGVGAGRAAERWLCGTWLRAARLLFAPSNSASQSGASAHARGLGTCRNANLGWVPNAPVTPSPAAVRHMQAALRRRQLCAR